MLEQKISLGTELEQYKKHGVAIFIINPGGELLTIREKTGSAITKKNSGEIGIPCETTEQGENWPDTVIRGLKEELGLSNSDIENLIWFEAEKSFLGETLFVPGVLARVVRLYCDDPARLEEAIKNGSNDNEVEVVGWQSVDTLLSHPNTRLGVRNTLNAYAQGYNNSEPMNVWLKPVNSQNLPMAVGSQIVYEGSNTD